MKIKTTPTANGHRPTARLETISPETAKRYLEKNYERNRNLSATRVEFLASEIKRRLWNINGATICFSHDGTLTDGQHRLAGCIKANLPIESFVVRGLPPKAFHSIDTGKTRTAADILRIAGELDVNVLACSARFIRSWDANKNFGHKYKERISFDDLAITIKRHPGLREAIRASHEYALKIKRIGPSFISAFYYLISNINKEEAKAFYIHLFEGTDLVREHPVLALRNRLIAESSETFRRSEPTKMFRLWVKTWNLFASGELTTDINPKGKEKLDTFEIPVKDWRTRYGITFPREKETARERE